MNRKKFHLKKMVCSTGDESRRGFTLVEILASMTILVFLVLMLTRVYTEGANAWKTGSRNTYRNMNARAVMDYIGRELSMAAFEWGDDPGKNFLGFAYNANVTTNNFGLEGADEIFFVRLNKTPTMTATNEGSLRSSELIRYYVANYLKANGNAVANAPQNPKFRYRLMRDQFHPSSGPNDKMGLYYNGSAGLYWMGRTPFQRDNFDLQGEVIDNVRTFEVFTYLDAIGDSQADWRSFNTNGNSKLAYLDIYLETFDEADAIRAAQLAANLGANNASVVEYVERAVKRNYRRVYLYNKRGYQDKW
jgi:prepilin-type N-terminal cleavage/methylation domain-containing protein